MSNPPTRLSAEELQAIRERANYERVSTSIWQERQDIAALLADRDALAADLRNAEGWIADVEEREAACCPEDVGFDEYIRHLQAELQEAREQRDMLQRTLETRAERELEMLEEVQGMTLQQAIEKVREMRNRWQYLYETENVCSEWGDKVHTAQQIITGLSSLASTTARGAGRDSAHQ